MSVGLFKGRLGLSGGVGLFTGARGLYGGSTGLTAGANWASQLDQLPLFAYDADGSLSGTPGATYLDGQYYAGFKNAPGATVTGGAGFLTNTDSAGNVTGPYAANMLGETDMGAPVWGARMNKCVNWNANPTDVSGITKSGDASSVLSIVDDTAALGSCGLSTICTSGKVYKLDNSAGATDAIARIAGNSGNTNAHVMSIYLRTIGGMSPPYVRFSTIGEAATFPAISPSYARVVTPSFTPGAATGGVQVCVKPGQAVYFILNQLEEGTFPTPVIPVAGAAATRTAVAPVITAPMGATQDFTIFVKQELMTTGAVANETLLSWDDGTVGAGSANNRVRVLRSTSNSIFGQAAVSGGVTGLGTVAAMAGRRVVRAVLRRVGGKCRLGINGAWLANETADLTMPSLSFLRIGHSSPGSEMGNARARRLLLLPGMSDAQALALTA